MTENAVMADPERCCDVLAAIAGAGVGVSVDDFGTGQSSLAQLRRIGADELKIDRSFVMGMRADPFDREVVAAVAGLARRLGMRLVAEGVRTAPPGTRWPRSAATSPRATGSPARCASRRCCRSSTGRGPRAWRRRARAARRPRPDQAAAAAAATASRSARSLRALWACSAPTSCPRTQCQRTSA